MRLAALGRVQGFLSRSPGYAVPLGPDFAPVDHQAWRGAVRGCDAPSDREAARGLGKGAVFDCVGRKLVQHGPPERRGYGTELITRALPYQLQAETALEFAHDGVRCRITLPASAFTDRTKERPHHGNGIEGPGYAAGPPRPGGGG